MSKITITDKDISTIAEKISSETDISKQTLLNIIAANLLGPKSDWSRIKNASAPLYSQRASAKTNPIPSSITLHDATDEDYTPHVVSIEHHAQAIILNAEDGTVIVIEFTEGTFGAMLYCNLSDGPVTIRGRKDHLPTIIYEGFIDGQFDEFQSAPPAIDTTPRVFIAPRQLAAFSPTKNDFS